MKSKGKIGENKGQKCQENPKLKIVIHKLSINYQLKNPAFEVWLAGLRHGGVGKPTDLYDIITNRNFDD